MIRLILALFVTMFLLDGCASMPQIRVQVFDVPHCRGCGPQPLQPIRSRR